MKWITEKASLVFQHRVYEKFWSEVFDQNFLSSTNPEIFRFDELINEFMIVNDNEFIEWMNLCMFS